MASCPTDRAFPTRIVGHEAPVVDKIFRKEHRWQTMSRRKIHDPALLTRKERRWGYSESSGAFLLHPGKRAAKLIGISCLKEIEVYAQHPSRRLRLPQKDIRERMGRIPQNSHPCDPRDGLFEQLDPFPTESLPNGKRDPSDVAARPSEAGDEAIA